MTTYRDNDIESLIADLRNIASATTSEEKQKLLTELHLKIPQKNIDKLYELCYDYEYVYTQVFELEEWI